MILIGSKAIKHHFPDFPREGKDTDYIVKEKPAVREYKTEYLRNPVLENYPDGVLDANSLYTLKISHLFWDINWSKHMWDVQWLKKKGCSINMELFHELYQYWNTYHGKNRRSNYNMSAEDFFDNAIKSEYEHDFLHTLIQDPPTFTKILKDGSEVDVCDEKFKALPFEDKCAMAREEIMVMAYERYKKHDYRIAYEKMLKAFIMNHCPIEGAIFIIENYKELHKPQINFIKLLNTKLKEHENIRDLVS